MVLMYRAAIIPHTKDHALETALYHSSERRQVDGASFGQEPLHLGGAGLRGDHWRRTTRVEERELDFHHRYSRRSQGVFRDGGGGEALFLFDPERTDCPPGALYLSPHWTTQDTFSPCQIA